MQRKKQVFLVVVVVLLIFALVVVREYTRKVEPVKNSAPDIETTAEAIIREFEGNDSLPVRKYAGKLIAVSGVMKQLDKDDHGFITLVLGSTGTMSAVRCAMDSAFASEAGSLQQGRPVTVKGMFTGYQKDETGLLGSDIILNRCVLEMDKKK